MEKPAGEGKANGGRAAPEFPGAPARRAGGGLGWLWALGGLLVVFALLALLSN